MKPDIFFFSICDCLPGLWCCWEEASTAYAQEPKRLWKWWI